MNVDLCENKQVLNKDIKNKLQEFAYNIDGGDNYTFYFSLKKLIDKNLVATNSSM